VSKCVRRQQLCETESGRRNFCQLPLPLPYPRGDPRFGNPRCIDLDSLLRKTTKANLSMVLMRGTLDRRSFAQSPAQALVRSSDPAVVRETLLQRVCERQALDGVMAQPPASSLPAGFSTGLQDGVRPIDVLAVAPVFHPQTFTSALPAYPETPAPVQAPTIGTLAPASPSFVSTAPMSAPGRSTLHLWSFRACRSAGFSRTTDAAGGRP